MMSPATYRKVVCPTFWGEPNPSYVDGESNQQGHKKKLIYLLE